MFAYTLNQAGQKFVTEAIEKHCKENTFADAFFADAEINADGNGSHFEIGSQYTLTGNPVFISLNKEHFDAQKKSEQKAVSACSQTDKDRKMKPLQVLQNKARHLRGLIQNNCDDKFNWIDAELGERLLADLKATNKRICELKPQFDSRGDMYLRAHD